MSEQPTAERVAEIKERAEKATSGEWRVLNGNHITSSIYHIDHAIPLIVAKAYDTKPDAEFIAHARQDIPFLLDLVESLQRERVEPQPAYMNTHVGLRTEYETPHTCGNCGEHIAAEWPFCPECGTATGIPATRSEPKPLTGALRFGQIVTGKIVAFDAERGLVSIKWEPKGEDA